MHRFTIVRRKSDARRGQGSAAQRSQDQYLESSLSEVSPVRPSRNEPQQLPHLPQPQPQTQTPPPPQPSLRSTEVPSPLGFLPRIPPSDFRASVLLPEFSQQFPVLRPGAQITVKDLKNRFADQRARGSTNQITEEEEDMILDALRFRSRGSSSGAQSKETLSSEILDNQSLSSSSNLTASPSSGRSKRYSNNLFGSGRLRDYTYMRSVASGRSKTNLASSSNARTTSVTPTESSVATGRTNSMAESTSSLRPLSTEGTTSISSIVSSLQGPTPPQQVASNISTSSVSVSSVGYGTDEGSTTSSNAIPTATAIEYKLAKTMDPAALKRASLALQEAIKELEDETEDEIVLPRSHTSRGVVDDASDTRHSYSSFEAGVAVTADKQVISSSEEHRTSPLPSRILPGYIPGMNRPMTPRDFDIDDRSHSTTPRATSPIANVYNPADSMSPSPQSGASGLGRKESISAATVRQSPRPSTPSLFLQRSPSANGRHTPEDGLRRSGGSDAIDFEKPSNSTLLTRRRPISPLSNLAAPASPGTATGSATSSRPSTPSNIIWQPSLSGNTGSLKSTHIRSDSWTSDTSLSEVMVAAAGARNLQAPQRNARSPPIPDSPATGQSNFTGLGVTRAATPPPDRAQARANGMNTGNGGGGDVFSSNRSQRSPTPTQNAPRSPSSPAFGFAMDRNGGSRRSSRQQTISPWGFTSTSYTPPMLNLFGNSSRTSIASGGSSYHSWEGDKDRDWYDQILSDEEPQSAWHDLSVGRTESPLREDQAEELVRKYFGLTMADFAAIQEKLVNVAGTKGEGGRKRKISVSQSPYAPARVNSPPPQIVQVPASPTTVTALTPEQYSKKASALLDSVVNDIQAKQPTPPPPPLDTTSNTVRKAPPSDPSPGTQKNISLADVLFGPHDPKSQASTQPDEPEPILDSSVVGTPSESKQGSVMNDESMQTTVDSQAGSLTASASGTPSVSSITQSPYQLSGNPSSARIPVSPKNEADIVREFQAKMAQADANMKNVSRSHLPGEGLSHSGSISRKRIDARQIGTPQLVSHSNPASLEALQTIPSRSPTLSTNNNSGTSKIGSRFKKLRGTLRAKHTSPLTEDLASFTPSTDMKSPQMANYDPGKLRVPGSPALMSATEPGRSKVSVPSPPASAGPGLKGFISRFRGKQRASEPPPAADKRISPQLLRTPPLSTISPRHQETVITKPPIETMLNPPPPKPEIIQRTVPPPMPPAEPSPTPSHVASPSTGSRQSVMIQQLFDAANNLGLDQNALNDLLARSGSISTRATKLARANSQGARSSSRSGQRSETPMILEQSNSGDTSQLTIQPPSPLTARPSQVTPEPGSIRPLVFRPPESVRRTRENHGDRAASTVVRRTIILPENIKVVGTDAQNVLQRANSGKRRRGSVNSGSLKDRAPTPPPPRSPISQRFSNDGSPPVPSLPQSLSPDIYLNASRVNMEKPNSTYDSSIYEMYTGAGDSRVQSTVGVESHALEDTQNPTDPVPALEFIEYANGDKIWSIVRGLRSDEDEESIYNGRASFSSEYSAGGHGGQDWDNMQVSVKEHARSNSRGSYSSFALKSKKQAVPNKSRPETKVFYSSTAQIGRLIENLSQGMDSGSFNFAPSPPRPGHSASSSLSTNELSMEDRLELMLGSLNRDA